MEPQSWVAFFGQLAKDLGPCLAVMAAMVFVQVMFHKDNQIRLAALERLLEAAMEKLNGRSK